MVHDAPKAGVWSRGSEMKDGHVCDIVLVSAAIPCRGSLEAVVSNRLNSTMSNLELGVQTEKAFQKQPLFLNSKVARKSTRAKRWYKDVGMGFKTPSAAVDGTYIGE